MDNITMAELQNDAKEIRDAIEERRQIPNDLSITPTYSRNPDELIKKFKEKLDAKHKELNGILSNLIRLITKESIEQRNKRIDELNQLSELKREFESIPTQGGKRKTRRHLKKNKKSKRKTSNRR